MRKIFFACVLFVSFPLLASAEPGFSTGEKFTATPLEGNITIQCNQNGHGTMGRFTCSDETLDPAEMVNFVGPTNVTANEVVLQATHADSSQASSSVGYNAVKGISTDYVNLWVSTLLQTPLLDYGSNKIQYTLKNGSTTVQGGVFLATVTKGQKRVCTHERIYFSANESDCTTGGNFCDQYFPEENYCQ
jgi:hypothetical protein